MRDPLYIICHIMKCAGTSLKAHIVKNFRKQEYLILGGNQPRHLRTREGINAFIDAMPSRKKSSLKVIQGANAFYGLHELFPDREVRYVMLVRDPADRCVSHYNFLRMKLHNFSAKTREINEIKNQLMDSHNDGNFLDCAQWLARTPKQHNFMCRFLSNRLGIHFELSNRGGKGRLKNAGEKMETILNGFFFIGDIKNANDFLFVLHLLNVTKFVPHMKVSSTKYCEFISESLQQKYLSWDRALYSHCQKLNVDFKNRNDELFQKAVEIVSNTKRNYTRTFAFRLMLLQQKVVHESMRRLIRARTILKDI